MPTQYAATIPFISRAADVPANQPFEGTLEASIRIDTSIISGQAFSGFSETISEITLNNAEGLYDNVTNLYSINGQRVRLAFGTLGSRNLVDPYNSFATIAMLTGERMTLTRTELTIELRDQAAKLVTETVQQNVYGGAGGLDGNTDIAGKRRPRGFGQVFNGTPTLVMPEFLLYQFNDGPVSSVNSVRDGGITLAFFADYATPEALIGATGVIEPGQYGTCIAAGYFMLGGTAFSQVTVDFQTAELTTATIIQAIATSSGGLAPAAIDTTAFAELEVEQPAVVQYYLDESSSTTCADAFTALMGGVGGWWGMTALGLLTVQIFRAPDGSTPAGRYDTSGGKMLDIDRVALPDDIDPPPHRQRMKYSRNWTVQSGTDIFGEVIEGDPAFADRLQKDSLVATTDDAAGAAVLANYPAAPDPDPIEGYFAELEDAQAEVDRIFALYSSGFQLYRFRLKEAMFLHAIGDIINVTDSRLGLSSGKDLRVVAITEDTSDMTTEIQAFG